MKGFASRLLLGKLLRSYVPEFLTVVFTFSQMVAINRIWGVETFGTWTLTLAVTGLVSSVLGAKTEDSVMRLFRQARDRDKPEEASAMIVLGLALDCATYLLAGLVSLAIWNLVLSSLLSVPDPGVFAITLSASFIGLMRGGFIGALIAERCVAWANCARTLDAGVRVCLILLLAPVFPENALLVLSGTYLSASVVTWVYSGCAVAFTQTLARPRFSRPVIRAFWKLNLVTYLSNSAKIGGQRLDTVVLSQFVAVETLGLYEVIKRLVTPVQYLHMPLVPIFSKPFVQNYDKGKSGANATIIRNSVIVLSATLIAYFLGLVILLKWIVEIQSIKFTPIMYLCLAPVAAMSWLNAAFWWLKLFTLLNNPGLLVWTSLTYTAGIIAFPVILFTLLPWPHLLLASLAYALPILPGQIWRFIAYRAYLRQAPETG